jgi:hypothetical protein
VLAKWPDDPMSLVVAAQAEEALGRADFAARDRAAARAGWGSGDPAKVSLDLI